MKKQEVSFARYFDRMKQTVSRGDKEKATEMIDIMLAYLGKATMDNIEKIENIKVDMWKSRVWGTLESIGGLPGEEKIFKSDRKSQKRNSNWIEKRTLSSSGKLKDSKVYHFQNTQTQEKFLGTRTDFKEKFSLKGGGISELINGVVDSYRKWVKIEN